MDFQEKVYSLLGRVPEGKIATYSSLARAAGSPKAARAVGTLMRKNPHPDSNPCYRIVRSDGSVGNYSGKGGRREKIAKLESDGIKIRNGKVVGLADFLFKF